MIIKIEQVTGINDPSPNKEALLTIKNIKDALRIMYPDESFSVTLQSQSIPDEQIAREKKSIREMKQAIGSLYNKLDSKILTDLMKKCENLISALQHKKEREG